MNNHQSDLSVQLGQLRHIIQHVAHFGFLGEALRNTRAFLTQFQYDTLGSRLEDIENDYRLMCDFLKKGYADDKRQELYNHLLNKLYRLLRDVELAYRKANDPTVSAYVSPKTPQTLDIESVRRPLEMFVADAALVALEPENVQQDKEHELYDTRHRHVQALFGATIFSYQWSHEFAKSMADLLVSPTIDSIDAQLLVSGTMLGAMLSGDSERILALAHVYEHALDEHVRQRALVGWVLALSGLDLSMCPQVKEKIRALTADDAVREELLELQIQMVYCHNAKRDNEKLQKEIMPNLMRNHDFDLSRLNGDGKDETSLDEILDPDAADRKMEDMEKTIRKMMDMRDKGVDIYFSGFSRMKRFAFFYTLCNWFVPFYSKHPQLRHLDAEFIRSGMVGAVLGSGAFCESDKYSFVLGSSSVYHNLPDNIKEMFNMGNVSMLGMPEHQVDTNNPSYIRRMYLQDLYRFFSLSDAHKMFENPFEPMQYLFMANDVFRHRLTNEARRVQKFLYKQKMYASLSHLFYAHKEVDNLDDMRMEAVLKMREGKYLQAQALYARLCEVLPDDRRALTGYAQACFYVEDYEEASQLYKHLCHLVPDNRNMALNLAISLINSDHVEEGMQVLYRLDYEDATDYGVKRAMAWGYLWLHHLDRAETLYQDILNQPSCTSSDYLNAAYCHWFLGRVDEAVILMRKSITIAGNNMKHPEDMLARFDSDNVLLSKYAIGDIDRKMVAELVMTDIG